MPPIILASASPRRQELLARLGLPFAVQPADVDEAAAMAAGGEPAGVAVALARAKAQAVAGEQPDVIIVAADTIVVADHRLLGKPADAAEARHMLALLRERTHLVVTGVALIGQDRGWEEAASTRVWMRAYSGPEVEASIARGATPSTRPAPTRSRTPSCAPSDASRGAAATSSACRWRRWRSGWRRSASRWSRRRSGRCRRSAGPASLRRGSYDWGEIAS